jgi:hypothetical protein
MYNCDNSNNPIQEATKLIRQYDQIQIVLLIISEDHHPKTWNAS